MLTALSIGLVGAAGFAAYHGYAPQSQLYGRAFCGTAGVGRNLALTFDDGPNDPYTLHLLDVLARHAVKATFFLIGHFVQQRPDIVCRIRDAGHEIGNHTYSHPNLIRCSAATVRRELEECSAALRDGGVTDLQLFRPPFGARRPVTLRIARELGLQPVNWSVTCYDWRGITAERIERHARRQIRGGDVILLHDGGYKRFGTDRIATVEATDPLIRRYKAEGFGFVRISEWMAKL